MNSYPVCLFYLSKKIKIKFKNVFLSFSWTYVQVFIFLNKFGFSYLTL